MHRLELLLLHKSPDEVLRHCTAHLSGIDCKPGSSVDAFEDTLCFSMRLGAEAADTSVLELEAGLESRRFLNQLSSLDLASVSALMTDLQLAEWSNRLKTFFLTDVDLDGEVVKLYQT